MRVRYGNWTAAGATRAARAVVATGPCSRRWLLGGAILICALLLGSGSASALVQRGHVFGSTFEPTGEGAFAKASGIAVNEATSELWVVDAGHERVEHFKPNGAGGYEFVAAVPVPGAEAIAIDNAAGS